MVLEQWVEINGSDAAEVSNLGRVRRNGDTVTLYPDSEGYLRCSVGGSVGRKRVHVLVAMAFVPAVEGKRFVNHKNGDKSDNRAENLEWVTPKENSIHAGRSGAWSRPRPTRRILAYRLDGVPFVFNSQAEAARVIGCGNSEINKALRGKRQSCHGYTFFYMDGGA